MVAKKETKPAAAFEMPKFDAQVFQMPKLEVPEAVREAAEKGVAQAKEAYEKLKVAAEETTELVEDTYATYTKGAADFSGKVLDFTKLNTTTVFDFAKDLLAVRSVAELVEKQTAFARSQFEVITAQTKELQGLTQSLANDIQAPVKAAAEKAISQFKKSA